MAETWYEDEDLLRRAVADGRHRDIVGGLWDEIGHLQFSFLIARGLRPEHRVLDIGCGSGRAGVLLAPYLQPYHYFGIDRSAALLKAAERELAAANVSGAFRETHTFDVGGWPPFDFAIAHSVFTHIPVARLTDCLGAIQPAMRPGAQVLATFFIAPDVDEHRHERGGVTTFRNRDPRHTTIDAIASATPVTWRMEWIGEWGHPRDQMIAAFHVR